MPTIRSCSLYVKNFESVRQFYDQVVGLPVVHANSNENSTCFNIADDCTFHINVAPADGVRRTTFGDVSHLYSCSNLCILKMRC